MLLLITTMAANAEESLKESPFSASLELSTKYMWRGIEYGTAPTVFPMIGYNTHGFNAFAMGGYAIDGSHQEVDLGVSYTASEFTVGVSDYYYPSSVGEKDQYFKLSNRETGHWVEAYRHMGRNKGSFVGYGINLYLWSRQKRRWKANVFFICRGWLHPLLYGR